MKSAMVVLIMLPFVCLLVSILLYLSNRAGYYKLISDFQKNYTLPAPYLLYYNLGYLGSPLMSYFLIRLNNKKKIFFLENDSPAYNFSSKSENYNLINRLIPLYYTFLVGFLGCCLLGITAFVIKILTLLNS